MKILKIMTFIPSYIKLFESAELKERIESAEKILTSCTCCPHNCEVIHTKNEFGFCHSGALPIVSSYTAHYGEEPVLSGSRGG